MKEKKERKVSLYKVVMLMLLTIFLTFMITSLLIYGYFINGKQLGKYVHHQKMKKILQTN